MHFRQRLLALLAFAGALGLGSIGCNTLTHPDDIVIAPEPKRAAAPPPPPAAPAAAPTPQPAGAAPSGG